MDEYITRNNAISAACFGCNQQFSDEPCEPSECTIRQSIMVLPTADVAPKSEVDKARQDGYEQGKRDVARAIYVALYNEIIGAINSNFEAIREREIKHNVNRYEDTFCYYCDGKIHALDGISYFMDKLTKKYTGENNNA